MKFRVSRFLKRDLVARVSYTKDGFIQNKRKLFEFYPSGKASDDGWYETDDEVLVTSLEELTEQLPYTVEAEEGLKKDNVSYEYRYCASCGGRKAKKLEYHLFEVEK